MAPVLQTFLRVIVKINPFSNIKLENIREWMGIFCNKFVNVTPSTPCHGKNLFDTPSKLELSISHKHPLGVEKVTTLVPSIFESNHWVASFVLSPLRFNHFIWIPITRVFTGIWPKWCAKAYSLRAYVLSKTLNIPVFKTRKQPWVFIRCYVLFKQRVKSNHINKRQAVEATVSETEELRNFLHNISVDGMLYDNMLKSLTWSTEAMDKVLLVSQMKCLVFLVMVQFHYNWLCRNLPFYYHDNKIGQYKFCGLIPYHRFNLRAASLKYIEIFAFLLPGLLTLIRGRDGKDGEFCFDIFICCTHIPDNIR